MALQSLLDGTSPGRRSSGLARLGLAAVCAASAALLLACGGTGTNTVSAVNYLYVANFGGNSLSAFSLDMSTGQLSQIDCGHGPTCNNGLDEPAALVASADGQYLFATNYGSASSGLAAFEDIGGQDLTGNLTDAGSAATGNDPDALAITPNGMYLYVANWSSSTLSAYLSSYLGGPPSPITCSACSSSSLNAPTALAISPNGDFLYAANQGTNAVAAFRINSDGTLSAIGTFATGEYPDGIAITPDGSYLYVTNHYAGGTGDSVSEFLVNSTTGTLSSIGSVATGSGSKPQGITVSPDGDYLSVADSGANELSVYSIDRKTGALTSVGTDTTGSVPREIAFSSSGSFLYVSNYGSDSISGFAVGSNGALAAIGTTPTGSEPLGIMVTAGTMVASESAD